ncbi:uncharacterized protein AB675_2269 [Cyphellophora attinorum]|uniref:Uncharacterized protein n=1 Tax=Cyphellophora attinorum TaxID=1664694 RepID=A0A0N1NX62_9EURO|nr:uncharacterized protein AB675_2269 [Phialophora attinorum]KPI34886.1 hypothetical protein AB675_2269 [Phialophora attinorum]
MSPQIHFLPVNLTLGHHDDPQVWRFDARRHSARVSNQRQVERERDEQQYSSSKRAKLFKTPESGLLDPFVVTCTDLTRDDRNRLHKYLTNVPADLYGTNAQSRLCPVRDITLGLMAANTVVLNWVLTSVSYREARSQTHDPASSPLVLRHRQSVYRAMNEMMKRDNGLSEDLMYGLAFAGLVENRIGGQATAQMHLRAALTVRDLRRAQGLSVVGLLHYFKNIDEIRAAHVLMTTFFEALQIGKAERLQHFKSGRFMPEDKFHKATHLQLRLLLMAPYNETAPVDIRMFVGLMLILNLAALELHQHVGPAESLAFLRLIIQCFQRRKPTCSTPELGAGVAVTGMLCISLMCIDYMGPSFKRTQLDVWQVIDMIHLLRLGSPPLMAAAKSQLLFWLLDDRPETPRDVKGYNDLRRTES